MLFGKKQRALERERDEYKAEAARLKEQNTILQIRLEDLTGPPEGCKIGSWCNGCKYADIIPAHVDGPFVEKAKVRACLYGACERREAVPQTSPSYFGCV